MKAHRTAMLIWIGWYQIIFLTVPLISSCSFQRAEVAANAKDKMVGMSKEQVLTCMWAAVSACHRWTDGSLVLSIRWRHEHSQRGERIN